MSVWGLLVVSLGMTVVPGIDTAMALRMTLKGYHALRIAPASTVAALPTALALATIPVACSFAGLALWAILSGRLRTQLQTPKARRIQERIMGSVLVALGVRVAAER